MLSLGKNFFFWKKIGHLRNYSTCHVSNQVSITATKNSTFLRIGFLQPGKQPTEATEEQADCSGWFISAKSSYMSYMRNYSYVPSVKQPQLAFRKSL